MRWILLILGTLGLALCVPVLYQVRLRLRETTLSGAWGWAVAGFLLWAAAWSTTVLTDTLAEGLADQLWYATAVMLLCPLIAVLGAKRPGSRAWAWFVLIPLLLVLGWPAVTAWDFRLQVAPLALETPAVLGYGLVLLMGVGNYFGTRFAFSSLLWGLALVLLVAPLSAIAAESFNRDHGRLWATLCMAAAITNGLLQARRPSLAPTAFDRLWIDFRDAFGIVWAKRILDRVNAMAIKEQWPARLEADGIAWTQSDLDPEIQAQIEARIDHTFRWLLRRFVDPPWIDRRLQNDENTAEQSVHPVSTG